MTDPEPFDLEAVKANYRKREGLPKDWVMGPATIECQYVEANRDLAATIAELERVNALREADREMVRRLLVYMDSGIEWGSHSDD